MLDVCVSIRLPSVCPYFYFQMELEWISMDFHQTWHGIGEISSIFDTVICLPHYNGGVLLFLHKIICPGISLKLSLSVLMESQNTEYIFALGVKNKEQIMYLQ